jgi:hypothetical protein
MFTSAGMTTATTHTTASLAQLHLGHSTLKWAAQAMVLNGILKLAKSFACQRQILLKIFSKFSIFF